MQLDKIKNKIIEFTSIYYEREHIPPTLRLIVKEFELNNRKFYIMFSKGVSELYELSKIKVK